LVPSPVLKKKKPKERCRIDNGRINFWMPICRFLELVGEGQIQDAPITYLTSFWQELKKGSE
jgi:hypothetical protein